ncbi:glutamate-1-semialdehyde 2,1-aminomutase [Burkholderia plantarii]|uniref:aspartate aminotransferase family protein n=1 Tax=Burkholderia plantarii TaxID=41899 RepID=UPI00272DAA2D|nr:glutamate-1-semialdehyde 2,1-aminomutase [Burkholderia plantarii]WLE59901.1 glutamate-1-semialdehyde 2,1-aminomutase [Burkholderia plantarii]
MTANRSAALFERGRKVIPNGVSSPMRAFAQVGGEPICAASAKGSRIVDADGRSYVDFLNAFGALLLGHAPDAIVAAIAEQAARGPIYGLSTELEYRLAERIVGASAAVEQLRFVTSGTEAVMTAARIARSHTGRSLLLKFRGSYHGHSDALLANPANLQKGSGNAKGVSKGISDQLNRDVLIVEYNDEAEVAAAFDAHGPQIAAVLVEPHATNMGFVKSREGFHRLLREQCDRHGALLIFDEVVTGFRFRFGPVCDLFGVVPDLVTFGKIIGGGTPIGAFGGRADVMAEVALGRSVFQSGTFSANPLTLAAGNAALDLLEQPGVYEALERNGAFLEARLRAGFERHGIPFIVTRHGALLGIAFRDHPQPLAGYRDVATQDYALFSRFHREMREQGFLLPPSLEEPLFLSVAHDQQDLIAFADTAASVLHALRETPVSV